MYEAIHRKEKMAAVHLILPQYVASQTKPIEYIERYGLLAVVTILTALLLSSLNDIFFLCIFIRSFRVFVRKAL